jgi:hypothetical protein
MPARLAWWKVISWTGMVEQKLRGGTMPSGDKSLGAPRLLFGDATLVFLLLNEVRHRIIARLFGVSRKDSNLVSVFAVGTVVAAFAAGATRLRRARVRPSLPEAAIGAAVLKETAHGIAGDWSRATPFFAGLIVLVALEKSFGPALRGSLRGVRRSFHGVRVSVRRVRAVLEGE